MFNMRKPTKPTNWISIGTLAARVAARLARCEEIQKATPVTTNTVTAAEGPVCTGGGKDGARANWEGKPRAPSNEKRGKASLLFGNGNRGGIRTLDLDLMQSADGALLGGGSSRKAHRTLQPRQECSRGCGYNKGCRQGGSASASGRGDGIPKRRDLSRRNAGIQSAASGATQRPQGACRDDSGSSVSPSKFPKTAPPCLKTVVGKVGVSPPRSTDLEAARVGAVSEIAV
jgi:hypothetical protein